MRTLEVILNEAERPEDRELDQKIIDIISVEPPATQPDTTDTDGIDRIDIKLPVVYVWS